MYTRMRFLTRSTAIPMAAVLALLQAGAAIAQASAVASSPAGARAIVVAAGPDQTAQLYLQARERLNSGDYREAATLFGRVASNYSGDGTGNGADALYWQAFALYRLGTPADLRKAH